MFRLTPGVNGTLRFYYTVRQHLHKREGYSDMSFVLLTVRDSGKIRVLVTIASIAVADLRGRTKMFVFSCIFLGKLVKK